MAVEPVVYGAATARRAATTPAAPITPARRTTPATPPPTTTPTAGSTSVRPPCCRDWRDEFIAALPSLGIRDRIPRFEEINERLHRATGWEIVGVPGLIPGCRLHAAGQPQVPGDGLDPQARRV